MEQNGKDATDDRVAVANLDRTSGCPLKDRLLREHVLLAGFSGMAQQEPDHSQSHVGQVCLQTIAQAVSGSSRNGQCAYDCLEVIANRDGNCLSKLGILGTDLRTMQQLWLANAAGHCRANVQSLSSEDISLRAFVM